MTKTNANDENEKRQLLHQILLFTCYINLIHLFTNDDVTKQCEKNSKFLRHTLIYMRNFVFIYKNFYKNNEKKSKNCDCI